MEKSTFQINTDQLVAFYAKVIKELEISNQFNHLKKDRVELIINKTSSYGWYIDDFSKESKINISKCLKFIYNNLPERLDEYLSDYYNIKIIKIEDDLKSKYPKRSAIISEAFYVHRNKLFHSSICLFITIIDGICDDVLDAKFFKNIKDLPEIKVKLEEKKFKYSDFLLAPIKNKGAINAWEKELDKYPIRLNRHEIIHGTDINYGNEINSLKIISMLSYIDYILTHFD
jgi:hypothetical protein